MSKLMKKVLSIVAAIAMVLTMSAVPAFAAGTGTITITPPSNTPSDTTNTYKIYKVFDADGNGTSISYKLVSGKTTAPAGFTVDSAGNVTYTGSGTNGQLTTDDIAAIASYVTESDLVDTATSTGTTAAVSRALPNGYYYITTSTGTAVTVNSTNPTVTVNDKNTVPSVDKTITGVNDGSYDEAGKAAIAQVGTHVSYKSEINVPGNTKNLKFTDTPGSGLSLDTDSLKVQVNGVDVATTNYTATITATGISISFNDTYIASLAANTKIDVTYTATITSDALTTSSDAGKNTASITYGDNNAKVTDEEKPTVYNATVTVNKTFQGLADGTALANNDSAQFVLSKTVTTGEGDEATTSTVYYKKTGNVVSWVNSIDDATKVTITQNGTGDGAFTGLADGSYTLVESKVPAGFNKAADTSVTIAKGNVTTTNLSQTENITNNTGSTLPSTGGMGTTIFYVLGAALVIGAGVVLVTRKRLS